jgi:hypothetical protein
MAPALMACWRGGAAGNFLFRLLLSRGGGGELQGHRRWRPASPPGVDSGDGDEGLNRHPSDCQPF